jgi:hypothetical protein
MCKVQKMYFMGLHGFQWVISDHEHHLYEPIEWVFMPVGMCVLGAFYRDLIIMMMDEHGCPWVTVVWVWLIISDN